MNGLKRRYTDLCIHLLREMRPEEEPQRVRVSSFALFGMMNWIYNWYRPGVDPRVEELADEMTRIFLHGFLGESPAEGSSQAGDSPSASIWNE